MNHKWLVVNGAIEDWPKNEIKVVKDDLLDPSQFRTETSSLRSRVEYHCRGLLGSFVELFAEASMLHRYNTGPVKK